MSYRNLYLIVFACIFLLPASVTAGVSEQREGIKIDLELDQERVGTEQTPVVIATITNTNEHPVRLWDLSFNSYGIYFGWKLEVKDAETGETIPRAMPSARPNFAFLPSPVSLDPGQSTKMHLQVPDRYKIGNDEDNKQGIRRVNQADSLPVGTYRLRVSLDLRPIPDKYISRLKKGEKKKAKQENPPYIETQFDFNELSFEVMEQEFVMHEQLANQADVVLHGTVRKRETGENGQLLRYTIRVRKVIKGRDTLTAGQNIVVRIKHDGRSHRTIANLFYMKDTEAGFRFVNPDQ